MNKVVIFTIVLAAAIVASLGIFFDRNIEEITKEMVEAIGSQVVGSRVQVEDVQLSLTEGIGHMSGITVANPQGFSDRSLFALGGIKVKLDTKSLTEDVYIVDLILIDSVLVLAEWVGGSSNIQALLDGMDSNSAGGDDSREKVGSEILFEVKEVSFTNGTVQLKSDIFGETVITLPDFTVLDLGASSDGLAPDRLVTAIVMELALQVKETVEGQLRELTKERALYKLKERIKGKALEGVEKLKKLLGPGI